jgi:putative membrane protein
MSEVALKRTSVSKSLVKGAVAGLIAGIVGTAAKAVAERIYPPRGKGVAAPPEVLANNVTGGAISTTQAKAAGEGIHWLMGASAGATYGAVAEYYPQVTAKEGASFGVVLGTLTHEGLLPAVGLVAKPETQTPREQASEMTSHIVYGVVTEVVRNLLRKIL